MVELDPELTVEGAKDADDPVGRPVALRATDWAAPLVTAVLIVLEAAEPAVTLAEAGEADREKSFGGGDPEYV